VIRPARATDLTAIEAIVERAYGVYVERIGMRPGPMDDDHAEQVRRGLMFVDEEGGEVAGLIVLVETGGGLLIENIAVDPVRQGQGIGRRLLEFAEETALAAGIDTLTLYTHEKMSENLTLYAGLGYVETERRAERGFSRVFMEKRLAPRSSAASTPA
jgi:GNAT superfamily N-acetyltransferase